MTSQIAALPPHVAVPLAAMQHACFPDEPWDATAVARLLALSGVFGYLAWQDDAPAGFLLARDVGDELEVLSLGVLPGWRRRGIGRALLAELIAEARRRQSGSVVLEVATDNGGARRLYAAFGFAQVGRRPRYYRRSDGIGDGLILRRVITAETSSD